MRGDCGCGDSVLACTCLSDDFEAVLALVGEILMSPSMPEEEIATRKGEVITSIRQDDDNPAVRATETLVVSNGTSAMWFRTGSSMSLPKST